RHLFTIPATVVVRTPSGGRHLWLSGPPDVVVPNSASRLAPGIDVRGAGGYLVGPGSRTDHGTYTAAPGTAHLPPAACPPALLRILLPPPRPHHPTPSSAGGHGQGLVQFVLAAHAGQRNTRLFWAACRAYEDGIGPALVDPPVRAALRPGRFWAPCGAAQARIGPALVAPRARAALGAGLSEREARATIASAARLTGHTP